MTTTRSATLSREKPQASKLGRRAERILEREISFIHHVGFARLKPESVELPSPPPADREPQERAPRQTALSPLFRAALLTPEVERALFRRMNFLKYRATRLRSQLEAARPQRSLIDEIEGLLRSADECRTRLVESNLRLVAATARRFKGAIVDFEELLCEGNVVLLHCVDLFDFSRGFRFSTYATNAIQRHLYRLITRRQRQKRRETVDNELLHEVAAAPEADSSLPPVVSMKEIERWLTRLDQRSRSIIVARFDLARTGHPGTLKAVSAEIGLSKERVRQLQFQALNQLRDGVPESIAAEWE
jgi:RNA polymerase primary sigma factor